MRCPSVPPSRTWFDSYFRANAANLESSVACGDRCRQVQTCAIANVDYDDYRMCVTQAKALSASGAICNVYATHVALAVAAAAAIRLV
jgi:hypothetical protein